MKNLSISQIGEDFVNEVTELTEKYLEKLSKAYRKEKGSDIMLSMEQAQRDISEALKICSPRGK